MLPLTRRRGPPGIPAHADEARESPWSEDLRQTERDAEEPEPRRARILARRTPERADLVTVAALLAVPVAAEQTAAATSSFADATDGGREVSRPPSYELII